MEKHATLSNVYDTVGQQPQSVLGVMSRESNIDGSGMVYNEMYELHKVENNEYNRLHRNSGSQHKEKEAEKPEIRSTEEGDIKAAMKKMKMILIISVIVNVVMLLLVTTVAIVGSIQSLPTSGESTSVDVDLDSLKSQYRRLEAETRNNISQATLLLDLSVRDVSQLNTSQILAQLDATNGNITSALDQFNNFEVNVSKIRALFNGTSSDIVSLQTQVNDLQLQVYCGQGEWRRVAYLNMNDPTQQCPSAWREYNTSGVRACGTPNITEKSERGCVSHMYRISTQYSRVCGRIIGYQYGSPDALHMNTIDQSYVDGISITHGAQDSREHIWTYAAGVTESSGLGDTIDNCPCSRFPGTEAPSFVGTNFYCESANPTDTFRRDHLFLDDKLWDGQQCEDSCCTGANTPPWFSTNLPMTTNDAIEVRICGTDTTFDEDTLIQLLEIYTQ